MVHGTHSVKLFKICEGSVYDIRHGTMYQNVSGFVFRFMGAQVLDTLHVCLCLWKLNSRAVMADNMSAYLLGCDTVFLGGYFLTC